MIRFPKFEREQALERARTTRGRLGKRLRRQVCDLEALERRALLASFSFSGYSSTGVTVAETGSGAANFYIANSLVGSPQLLEWSTDGSTWSTNWGAPGQTLAANTGTSIAVTLTTASSGIYDGVSSSPASQVLAALSLNAASGAGGAGEFLTVNDSTGTLSNPTYNVAANSSPRTITTSPQNNINVTLGADTFRGGITLDGNNGADTYNVATYSHSLTGEPVTINGGSGGNLLNVNSTAGFAATATIDPGTGTNTVNVATGNVLAQILARVFVADSATVAINDSAYTLVLSNVTFDNGGTAPTPYEVTGLGLVPIEWGTGVTAVNLTAGTPSSGTTGNTYNLNETQNNSPGTITTTTITGGTKTNTYNIGNSGVAGGLNNLGPVVINGGGAGEIINVNDQDNGAAITYGVAVGSITSSSSANPGFGGLTYSGLGAGNIVTLNASDFGGNTITANSTDSGGNLYLYSGSAGGNTVELNASSEPVYIYGGTTANTYNIGAAGAGDLPGITGAVTITASGNGDDLNVDDSNDASSATYDVAIGSITAPATTFGGITYSSLGATVTPGLITLSDSGIGGSTVNVTSTDASAPLDVIGNANDDSVNIGSTGVSTPGSMGGILGAISVSNPSSFTNLYFHDENDGSGQTWTLTDTGSGTGTVAVTGSATTTYVDNDLYSLTIYGANIGGNTFNIHGTPSNVSFSNLPTSIYKGPGSDNTVNVYAIAAASTLYLYGGAGDGTDSVNVYGVLMGALDVDEVANSTNLVIDLSTDGLAHDFTLSSDGTTTTLSDGDGNFATMTWSTSAVNQVTIDTDPADAQALTVDFGGYIGGDGGNPVPQGGLNYNAGGDGTLYLEGQLTAGAFASETDTAYAPDYSPSPYAGAIVLTPGGESGAATFPIEYTGLQPVIDTASAIDYTFNDEGYPDQSFSATSSTATTGPNTYQSLLFASTPTPSSPATFESHNIANKQNVTFATPALYPGQPNTGLNGTVDIPTASAGLSTLTFNTSTGNNNTVSFLQLPTDVTITPTLNTSTASDTTNATGIGVPSGTTLTLNAGSSSDVLNYDAGGETPTITAVPNPNPAGPPIGVAITIPGQGTVDAFGYSEINITNGNQIIGTAPIVPAVTPTTINSVEGVQLSDVVVATFTFPLNLLPFTPTPSPLPASDFTATIDWGDGTTPTPGIVVQDASGGYYVEGTHTYNAATGLVPTIVTVTFAGGPVTGLINGVPATITLPASAPGTGGATPVVNDATIAVTAFPFVATEGVATTAPVPIATFIDSGGADAPADYTVNVSATGPDGTIYGPITIPTANIVQVGTSNQFTVILPAGVVLPEEGTYQILVTVTDSDSADPASNTASGSSLAVIADAPLTASTTALAVTESTGVSFTTVVGVFADANTGGSAADFTAGINWGDGSPNSIGTIVPSGVPGEYDVIGTHTYASYTQAGSPYNLIINVFDDGGSQVTLITQTAAIPPGPGGAAAITVNDLSLTGTTFDIPASNGPSLIEGQSTGTVLLAQITDPNMLATAADLSATIDWGQNGSSAGTVVQVASLPNGDTVFDIYGSHVYTEESGGTPYTFTVTVTTVGGAGVSNAPLTGSATVLDAPLTGSSGNQITGVEGIAPTANSVFLGSFTDSNPYGTIADFTPTVVWGGAGSGGSVTITQLGGMGTPFLVYGSFTYNDEGTYAYTVTINDDGGQSTTVSGAATIADAPLTAGTITVTPAPPLLSAGTVVTAVGTFTDANPLATTADFTATIDWGDGSAQSAGAITQLVTPAGDPTEFDVTGTHTYAYSGMYTITMDVKDEGGSTVTITDTIDVEYPNLYLQGNNFVVSLSPGGSMTDITIDGTQYSFITADISNIYLFGKPGTDSLTVDDSNGGIPAPIYFYATPSGGSWMALTGSAAASSDTYTPGATPGSGTSQIMVDAVGQVPPATQMVYFSGLSPVFDNVVATTQTVVANNASNAITYQEGDSAPATPNTAWGQVAVDALEPFNFTNKTHLIISTLGGTDTINLNNTDTTAPTDLASIDVAGGDPTPLDTLIINAIPGSFNDIGVIPTGAGAGTVRDNATGFVPVTFSGMAGLNVVGVSADKDALRVGDTTGDDTVAYTPGATADEGSITGFSSSIASFAYTPITFSGITGYVVPISSIGGGTGTDNELIVNGTAGANTFTFNGARGTPPFSDFSSVVVDGHTPIFYDPTTMSTNGVVLDGIGSNNTFNVIASTVENAPSLAVPVTIVGSGTGDVINFTANPLASTVVNYATSTITSTGANPINFSGVATVNVNANGGTVEVEGAAGNDNFTYSPSTADSGSGTVTLSPLAPVLNVSGVTANGFAIQAPGGTVTFVAPVSPSPTLISAVGSVAPTVRAGTTLAVDFDETPGAPDALVISGGAGSDALSVFSGTMAFTIPITFNGGSGGGSSLILTGGTATDDHYRPGPATGAGNDVLVIGGLTETVNFTNLSPVYDSVGGPLTVDANDAANSVSYVEGTAPGDVLNPAWGRVSIDNLESINFMGKGTLTIDTEGGNDEISLDNTTATATTPVTSIFVHASTPTTGNSLVVDGTTGADAIGYSPTSPGAGTVQVNALPLITFTGISDLNIDGQGAGDALTVRTLDGDQVTLTSGSAVDSGTATITSGGGAPVSFTPLDFSNLGAGGSLIIAASGEGATNTLIYDGTTASDTFSVAAGTGTITLSNTATGVAQIPVLTPSVTQLVLNGISGDDTFDVTGPQPYTAGIALEGGPSDPSVANLTGDGSSPVLVTLGGTTTFVTGGGLGTVANPLTLTGVGVINVNNGTNGIDIGGTTGQPNDFVVTPTGANTATVQDNGIGPVVNTTNTGLLDIGGALDTNDVVTVDGTAANGSFTAVGAAAPSAFSITSNFKTITLPNPTTSPAAIGALVVNAGPGNGNLTVNSATAPFTIPITFNGGTGGGSALILGGGTATSDIYTPGAAAGAGTSALEFATGDETVNFTNLQPVFDYVAGPLTVTANNANNAITYQQGSALPIPSGLTWGQVAVDSLEVINFTQKSTLTIDAAGGNDWININDPTVPTGLGSPITVTGDTASTDSLLVNGTTGADTIGYAPSGPGAGGVTITGLPTVAFTGMGSLAINGQGGGDSLTVTTGSSEQVTLTAGSAVDSGTVSITSGGGSPVSFTPLNFSNLGSASNSSLTVSGAGTLIYDGTTSNDTFTVTGSATAGDGTVSLANSATPPVSQIPVHTAGVTNLVLAGISGDDTFNVTATTALPLPYTGGITLEGGPSDPSVANLTGNGVTPVIVTMGATTTTVTGGGLGAVTLSGVGVINVGNAGGGVDVEGAAGRTNNLAVTPTGANTASIQDNGTGPWVDTNDTGSLVLGGTPGNADTVTVDGTAGNSSFTVAAGSPNTISSAGKTITLNLTGLAALAVNEGPIGGTLTVNSSNGAFPLPISFNGGTSGASSLILTGGAALSDIYTPGPATGAGSIALNIGGSPETVTFSNLSPVYDFLSGPLTVVANNANNTITYQEGSSPTGPSTSWGQVAVDNSEAINFNSKTSLTINTLSGSDAVDINNPNVPTSLTSITVNGAGTLAGNSLTVNGTTGQDAFDYTPSAAATGAGTVTTSSLPSVTFTDMGSLAIDGRGGNDTLTITTVNGPDSLTLTPGAAVDSGTVSITRNLGAPASATPVSYSNLGSTGALTIANGPATSPDTLIYDGTAGLNTFAVAATTGQIILTTSAGTYIPVNTPGVNGLVLNGLGGTDTFNVAGPQPYSSITLEGGTTGPNVANLGGNSTSPVVVTLGGNTTTVTGGALAAVASPLTLVGVGTINVANAGGGVDVEGAAGQTNNLAVTPTGANTASMQDNGKGPWVDTNDTGSLVLGGTPGNADTVTVIGTAGNSSFTATAGSPNTISSADKTVTLNLIGLAALAVNEGPVGGTLTVNSTNGAFPLPITFNGGTSGASSLSLIGGSAMSDVYTPGPATGAGSIALNIGGSPETVSFTNLAPVFDAVAGPLTVNANNANNAITYQSGSSPAGPSATWGQVAVDALEVINFINKGSLVINAAGGNDSININNPNTPGGMTSASTITVIGDSASTDSLIVNGTALADTIGYTPSAPGAGMVTVNALPAISFTGMGNLAINGQSGGDNLTVSTPSVDQVTITPGSAIDAGAVTITTSSGSPVNFTPLAYSNLGAAAGRVTISGAATLVYEGMTASDTFTVTGSTTPGVGEIVMSNSANPPVSRLPVYTAGVSNLVLNGISGNDTFDVTATIASPLPYTAGITLEGGPSDPSVANLAGNAGSAVTATLGGTSTTVIGGGLGVTLSGIGVINVSNGSGEIDVPGTGLPGQLNSFAVTPTGPNTAMIQDNGIGPVVNTTNTGALFVGGSTDVGDVVTINGTGANTSFTAFGATAGTPFTVTSTDKTISLVNPVSPPPTPIIASLVVNAGPGNGSLTVNSASGPFTIPITFNGGAGGGSWLSLTGGTAISDVYTPGSSSGTGTDVLTFAGPLTQTVNFTNLSPVFDFVSGPLTVVANNANNAITYQEGTPPSLVPTPTWGQVAIDNSEAINFINKSTLTISTLAGNDAVTIDNANVPTGLTSIAVNGNGPAAGDSLTVDGTTGLDAINYTPSTANPGAGSVTVNALPAIAFTGMGSLAINGQGGNDSLTVTTANLNVPQPVSVTLTPGAALDSGTVAITRSVGASSSATPLSFTDLGSAGSLAINNGTGTAAGTFIYNGTVANDTFNVAPTTGQVTLTNTASGLSQIPVTTSGIAGLALVGLAADDIFNVPGPQPYQTIALEGGASDPPMANLTGSGAAAMAATLGGAATVVTGGGLGTVTLTSVGIINLNTAGSNLSVTGTAGQSDNIAVTPTSSTTAQIKDNGTAPAVNASLAGGTLTVSGNANDSDIVTVNGTTGNDLINVTGTGASTGPIVSVNSLLPVTVGLSTSALNIASGQGNDTVIVNSATYPVTTPVTYVGGGGSDLLILQGGTASSDVYTPGPVAGAGASALTFPGSVQEHVSFQNLAPVQDLVTSPTLTVNGTSSNDIINYTNGGSGYGLVTVDSFESISFVSKTQLIVQTNGGDNTVVLNNATNTTGLTSIAVTGGTGSNTLVVNANNQLVSSSQITATAVNGIVGTPTGTAIPVNYSNMALVHVINSIDALTGIPAPAISSVAGVQLYSVLVASFKYTDQPPAEVSQASEFIATIDWGDGTVANPDLSAGTIIELAPYNNVVTFQVYGTHTYAGQGNFTASVTIYDTGSSRTFTVPLSTQLSTVTANPGTLTVVTPVTSTVNSAPISSTGTPTNQVAGITATTLVATIVDPNPGASTANYTQPGQTPPNISINWGDGTPNTIEPVSVDPTNGYSVVQIGTQPNGVVFEVFAPHKYAQPGNYTVTTTIYRYTLINGVWTPGSATVAVSNEIVSSAPLSPGATQPHVSSDEATTYPTPEFGPAPTNNPFQLFSGPVAYFTDANTSAPKTPPSAVNQDYKATIDWGDGTPQSAGTISFSTQLSEFVVSGTHTYATSGVNGGVGTYPVTVYITGQLPTGTPSSIAPSTLTVTNTAVVTDNPVSVTGILNPASDTGKSNTDGITYDTQPNFYGTVYATLPNGTQVPDPYAHVALYANGVAVGYVQAGSDGTWSITSNVLAQGTYNVTAMATDQFGQTVSPMATIFPTLVVDTTPPVITSLSFNRFDGTLTVVYQDNVAMNLESITDSAFYHISATPLVSDVHVPKLILPTSIYYTPGPTPNSPITVNVVFDKGKVFRGGNYEVIIDSGTGNSGVQDLAGNALAGTFYGSFPTGNGHPGGNFQANILTYHNKVRPFLPTSAGYSPPPKGIDPPAGSSLHLGKGRKAAHVKAKKVVHRSTSIAKTASHKLNAAAVDNAIGELITETKHHKK